jgi:hypothetical protein
VFWSTEADPVTWGFSTATTVLDSDDTTWRIVITDAAYPNNTQPFKP